MWKSIWESHGGRISGVAAGTILFIAYICFGFWDMLFLALLVFIGYTLGKQKDLKLGALFPWQRMADWLTDRWRLFK
ncbi:MULTISPECIES: DUF2273 domain-containing protein [unclassified Paenibacillus]|uniref:DUF2273 domain-containing protein n=1 Tax=unclassified Paenibacillus TaxID=185978 RepID=UPI001C104B9A|nr:MULTISPECIES: DUF2273 domain-containing protein [unclassified Paenibacillus]MBU5443024.1 DUF2273 domain-containing protein [Paenibacillus sp. MSJ-34]CAH0118603.1 hypothetical protein PAE9249_01092 [Paenibacillus sp. CECT 9249]